MPMYRKGSRIDEPAAELARLRQVLGCLALSRAYPGLVGAFPLAVGAGA
jgi:hypothetical protein